MAHLGSAAEPMTCAWCGRPFTPRTTGGHAQRFCSQSCRRAYDAAGRRFVAEAIACGLLSLDQIRKGAAATRALLLGGISPPQDREDGNPTPVAPPEHLDEAAELLDELLTALGAPDRGWYAAALPVELVERLCDRIGVFASG
jgi:hypothetical protein